jgi:type II secretory pathway component PulM
VKKYFEQLRPLERRLVIGVGVVLLIVLNWVFIWPHFSDWGSLTQRYNDAQEQLKTYQAALAQKPELEKSLKDYESEGEFVAQDDQVVNFMRAVQQQASASGFGIQSYSRSMMTTNQFFVNQIQNIQFSATEAQLVDFLYKLGNSAAMIRVRDLELQPDQPRQRLNANIRLMASYQKNPKAPAPAPAAARATTNSTAKPK